MTIKFWVAFKLVNQPARRDIQLEVDELVLNCDVVLRALGNHLNPLEEWPFSVEGQTCSGDTDVCRTAVQRRRIKAAREHLGIIYISYRTDGEGLESLC